MYTTIPVCRELSTYIYHVVLVLGNDILQDCPTLFPPKHTHTTLKGYNKLPKQLILFYRDGKGKNRYSLEETDIRILIDNHLLPREKLGERLLM